MDTGVATAPADRGGGAVADAGGMAPQARADPLQDPLQDRLTQHASPVVQRVEASGDWRYAGVDTSDALPAFRVASAAAAEPVVKQAKWADNAYVVQVPTPGGAKNKAAAALANQYAAEAFSDAAQAKHRMALTVAVNTFESAGEVAGGAADRLNALVQGVAGMSTVRVGTEAFTWNARFERRAGPLQPYQAKTLAEARQAAADDETERGHILAIEQHAKSQATTAGVATMGRNLAMASGYSSRFVSDLKAAFSNVYVQLGDADAVSLKAASGPDETKATPLFDRFDKVIGKDAANRQVVSGGYLFHPEDEAAGQTGLARYNPMKGDPDIDDAAPHQAGQTGAPGLAKRDTMRANVLDQTLRETVDQNSSQRPYYPEPNTLVRSDLLYNGAAAYAPRSQTPFGNAGAEWPRLQATLSANTPGFTQLDPAKQTFDTRATLYTDAGRWQQKMAAAPANKRIAAAFHASASPQSHADLSTITRQVRSEGGFQANGPGNNQTAKNRAKDLLNLFLPQQLFKLAGGQAANWQTDAEVSSTLKTRSEGTTPLAAWRDLLDKLPAYLEWAATQDPSGWGEATIRAQFDDNDELEWLQAENIAFLQSDAGRDIRTAIARAARAYKGLTVGPHARMSAAGGKRFAGLAQAIGKTTGTFLDQAVPAPA